jgi:hypothetical protein
MPDSDELGPDPTSQALIRLVPKLGPIVATWRQETHERRQRRAEQLGTAAAEGIGVEQLFEQIASDERLTDMFNAAVEASIATSSDAKIRLLGRALAAGATAADEAKVDEAEQLLRIALELDPVDLRAMRALERRHVGDAVYTVAYALDISPAIAGPVVARLERLHLLSVERMASISDKKDPDDDQVNIDEEWGVTDTAAALLGLLRQQEHAPTQETPRASGAPWSGFTEGQALELERLAQMSGFEWRRKPEPDRPVFKTLARLELLGVPYGRTRDAMRSIGFDRARLEDLDQWSVTRA